MMPNGFDFYIFSPFDICQTSSLRQGNFDLNYRLFEYISPTCTILNRTPRHFKLEPGAISATVSQILSHTLSPPLHKLVLTFFVRSKYYSGYSESIRRKTGKTYQSLTTMPLSQFILVFCLQPSLHYYRAIWL